MNKQEEIQPELKDIIEAINRFIAVNKGQVAFIGWFAAFNDNGILKRDEANLRVGYGPIPNIARMLEGLEKKLNRELGEEKEFINW